MANISFDVTSIADYQRFLQVKLLPRYRVRGRQAEFPDEYADRLGVDVEPVRSGRYDPVLGLFDYQRDIVRMAIDKRKFAIFAECGLGKTLMELEYARHVASQLPDGQCVLIVAPLMVVRQTIEEAEKFYGRTLEIEQVASSKLTAFLADKEGCRIGVTNYEALKDTVPQGRLGALILDESSALKAQYGKWSGECLRLGSGLDWKLCLTGTPAPNDRIEFANHAVFLDAFQSANAFLATFFVNRGETSERWELKAHAIKPFYRSLSHWSIFLTNPATYGWKDNVSIVPPIHVHIHDIDLGDEINKQVQGITGTFFPVNLGGITKRTKLAKLAKGKGSPKPAFIRQLVESWPDESTIIWCRHNDEQARLEAEFPGAASIEGSTPYETRHKLIDEFKSGQRRVLISKARVLGFGLNLQVATRQVFSGIQDSYEEFWQAVKRSNRIGSTKPLNVHIPISEVERPMMDTVLSKAARVDADTKIQEEMFRDAR